MTDNPNGDDVVAESKREGVTRDTDKPPWCGVHTEAVVCYRATCPEDDWKGPVRVFKSDAHLDARDHNEDHHERKQHQRLPATEGEVEWVDENPPTYIVPER